MLKEAAQAGKRDAEQQVEHANKLISKAMNKESHLDTLIDREARARVRATQDSMQAEAKSQLKRTKAILYLPTVYAVVLTVFELTKLPHLWTDVGHFFLDLWLMFKIPATWLTQLITNVYMHDIVFVLVCILILIGIGFGIAGYFWAIYRLDWTFIDTLVVMSIMIGILLFDEVLRSIIGINLIWLLVILLVGYVFVRGIFSRGKFYN